MRIFAFSEEAQDALRAVAMLPAKRTPKKKYRPRRHGPEGNPAFAHRERRRRAHVPL